MDKGCIKTNIQKNVLIVNSVTMRMSSDLVGGGKVYTEIVWTI